MQSLGLTLALLALPALGGAQIVVTPAYSMRPYWNIFQPTQTVAGQPALNMTTTWNAGGVTFTGIKFVITDTASAAGSIGFLLQRTGLGTTTKAGIPLENPTAAAAGAQQYSPGLSLIGQGWKTDATAASQPVEARFELRPVQGAAAPTYLFALMGRVNAGTWSNVLTVTSDGDVTSLARLFSGGSIRLPNANVVYWATSTNLALNGDGGISIRNSNNTANVLLQGTVTGGAALSSHAISLAQDATTKVGTAPVGILTVVNTTDSEVCTFSVIGVGVVAELSDSGGNCSITKDNAATVNVYYDTNGVYVQNKIAATKSVRLVLNGV